MASSARARSGSSSRGSSEFAATVVSDDPRLSHAGMPDWQKGTRQPVLGSDYVIVEPNTKIEYLPTQLDFDLPKKESLLFGPMCKFRVKGVFQKKEENASTWTNLTAAESSKILLAPNWMEALIKEASVYHENYRIASSSENRFISPFVNAYLYHNMDPLAKKLLCPQPCHPGYCVPEPDGKWAADATAWTNYAKEAFVSKAIGFDYTPLFLFPFYQGGSYLIDDNVPRILPAPSMGRIQIRFTFTDSQDHIFRKATPDTNKAQYRFAFTEFNLVLEEARLSSAYQKQLHNRFRPIAYPGISRIQLVENVTAGSASWTAKFQDIYLPEALFIFGLNKSVASGTYKFSTDTGTSVFTAHNLESVDIMFDGKRFSLREPRIGMFRPDMLDIKTMMDHLVTPPFGIRQDPKGITPAILGNGSEATSYPHIYIHLVVGPDRERLIPTLDDGSCINKKATLDLDFKFTETNAPADTIFVIYAIYSDVNMVYDPKTGHFSSPYLQYMN